METSLKLQVLLFLYFSSLAGCFQPFPSLNINPPVEFNFDVASVRNKIINGHEGRNAYLDLNKNDSQLSKCFCVPNNSDNRLVTQHLIIGDQGLERLVVYFYRSKGLLQAFIPNKQKQIMLPDLSFDEMNGDTLKLVFEDPAVDIFEGSASVIKKLYPEQANGDEEANIVTLDREPDNQLNPVVIPSSDNEEETIDSEMENLPDEEEDSSLKPSDDNNPLDEHNMPLYEHDISTEKQNLSIDNQTEIAVDSPQPSAENLPNDNLETENINNIYSFDKLHKMLSKLPQDSRLYLQSLFPQLIHLKEEIQQGNKYISFDKWFKGQLTGIILHHLPTASDIDELKQRIIEVLENNGIRLSNDGKLFDSNGNLLIISNIKLRPILIGEPIETQFKVSESNNKYVTSTEMSYFQVILITLVHPPSLLGVVPVGKVHIPRDINRELLTSLNNQDEIESRSGVRFGEIGCKTCNHQGLNKIQYSHLRGIPYFQLPLRKNFKTQGPLLIRKLSKDLKAIHLQTLTNPGNNINKVSYENIGPKLLRIFGRPNILGNQSYRILGGKVLKIHKPDPHSYPDDDLPGFRIIGGNPAISSGTPLVSKGRSGFEKPF